MEDAASFFTGVIVAVFEMPFDEVLVDPEMLLRISFIIASVLALYVFKNSLPSFSKSWALRRYKFSGVKRLMDLSSEMKFELRL